MNSDCCGQDRAVDDIQRNLQVTDEGPNIVRMTYTSGKPDYIQSVISQSIQVFVAEIASNQQSSTQLQVQVLQKQLNTDKQAADNAKKALDTYLRANPSAPTSSDAIYYNLTVTYNDAQTRYNTTQSQIEQLISQKDLTIDVSNSFFRVMDPPGDPSPYRLASKDIIRNSLLALVMALLVVVALTLVGTWTDNAIYTLNDVSSVAVTEEGAASSELLVGIVPFIKTLGNFRRDVMKQEKKARRRGSNRPNITVVNNTDIVPRGVSSDNTVIRPIDVQS